MTRETKIGLLVGLAFIIVIGVLLSDHLTTRGELPQAQLTQVGNNVRVASAVPAGNAPPIAPVTVPQGVTPTAVVQTQAELHQAPPTSLVQVGPSKGGITPAGQTAEISVNTGATQAMSSEVPVLTAPTKDDGRFGQPLMVAEAKETAKTSNPVEEMRAVQPNQPPAQAANPTLKAIKAEKGDTVSHLAARYLGANTNANRQAIIDANPALKANPAKIVIGHTYMIPTKSGQASTASAVEQPAASPAPAIPGVLAQVTEPATLVNPTDAVAPQTTVKKAETTKAAKTGAVVTTSTYKVKANDTLWKIASTQLGDGSLSKEIQDLNKDVLKGKDIVREGMTLKLPAKQSVASR